MNGLFAFFHGVGIAIGTAFIAAGAFLTGQSQPVSPAPTTMSTTSVETTATESVTSSASAKVNSPVKKPAPLPSPQVTQAPVIQVPTNTPQASQQSQTVQEPAPATKGYYENGSYVYLTDAEHQALLQQLQSTVQDLKNQEQPYVDDFNKAESEIQKACAYVSTTGQLTTGTSPVAEGNAAITAQTQAYTCSAISQAYAPSIQIDKQAINYYEAKIQSLESSYN